MERRFRASLLLVELEARTHGKDSGLVGESFYQDSNLEPMLLPRRVRRWREPGRSAQASAVLHGDSNGRFQAGGCGAQFEAQPVLGCACFRSRGLTMERRRCPLLRQGSRRMFSHLLARTPASVVVPMTMLDVIMRTTRSILPLARRGAASHL